MTKVYKSKVETFVYLMIGVNFLLAGPICAQGHDEGVSLGVIYRVQSVNPYVLELSIEPQVSFSTVSVETPNADSKVKEVCTYVAPSVGQRYTCSINGTVSNKENGFVVSITGLSAQLAPPAVGAIVRKTITVPNPSWNQAAHKSLQESALTQRGRATTIVNR